MRVTSRFSLCMRTRIDSGVTTGKGMTGTTTVSITRPICVPQPEDPNPEDPSMPGAVQDPIIDGRDFPTCSGNPFARRLIFA